MDDPLAVRRAHAVTNGGHQLDRAFGREPFLTHQQVVQRFSLHEFHHEERNFAFDDAVIGNVHHVVMTYRRRRQRFLAKTRHQLRVVSDQVRQNHLDGVRSFEICVAGFIDDAHAALPQAGFELVFSLQQRFAVNSMISGSAVLGTNFYVVRITTLAARTLSHGLNQIYNISYVMLFC